MGKFDGVLLCTDFDGTLAHKAHVSPENAAAIRYFKENGGRFTVVSGRNPMYMKENPEITELINAPLVGYNGARIWDPQTDSFLYDGGCQDHRMLELLCSMWQNDTRILEIWAHSATRHTPKCNRELLQGNEGKPLEDAPLSFVDMEDLIAHTVLPLYNVICITSPEDSAALRDSLRLLMGDEFRISRSWTKGVEIIRKGEEKGDAVRFLKEHCRARLLITVGDFENDISMLLAGDIGYAVANATEEVKALADRLTVDCAEHAIAAVIRELESEL